MVHVIQKQEGRQSGSDLPPGAEDGHGSGRAWPLACVLAALLGTGTMVAPASAQTWTLRPSGTAFDLNDVVFSSASTAVAVGATLSDGLVTVSRDSGATWNLVPYTPPGAGPPDLRAVFSSAATVVAVGEDQNGGNGAVVGVSNDRGASWADADRAGLTSATTNMVDGVFSGSSTAIAVGNGDPEVFFSNDRGASWADVIGYNAPDNLNAVAASGDLVVAVGDNNTLSRSASTGAAWSNASSAGTVAAQSYNDVVFASTATPVAVGTAGTIIRSTDGGDRWRHEFTAAAQLNAVDSRDATVIAVGNGGALARSTDFGASWANVNSGVVVNLNDVLFLTSSVVLAAGVNGTIISSSDGGVIWGTQTTGVYPTLNVLAFNGANRVVAVGLGGTILLSTDQIGLDQPIPFRSKWLLVLLLAGYGAWALHRMRS